MALQPVALADAGLQFDASFLSSAEAIELQAALSDEIGWERHRIRLFGREIDVPRLSSWIGDADANYRYSGSDFVPRPWTPTLQMLRTRIEQACGARFNSVLANRYRDGRDSMGWHSDDEPELGPNPVIASLSLGAERRFLLRHRRDPSLRWEAALPSGSLLVMRGPTQTNYRHQLPRSARPVGERINLTFRWVLATGRSMPSKRGRPPL